jgi:hypothetical protein
MTETDKPAAPIAAESSAPAKLTAAEHLALMRANPRFRLVKPGEGEGFIIGWPGPEAGGRLIAARYRHDRRA